jgi:hypothetical protein
LLFDVFQVFGDGAAVRKTIVVFTHAFVMRTLLWLQQGKAGPITNTEMEDFDSFGRRISMPNCAVLRSSRHGSGHLRLSANVFVAHIPMHLRTE